MQKSTITFKSKDYLVRTVDISHLQSYKDYSPVDIAGVELNMALGDDKESTAVDEKIFFYLHTESWLRKASDKKIIEELEQYLF